MKNIKIASIRCSTLAFFLVVYTLFFNKVYATDTVKRAPGILFSKCLNHPTTKNGFYKNKYIILDFWATWCGPCIASFPHMDSLSGKFSSDNVVFAIISSEPQVKVARFLKTQKIKAYSLLDSITSASKASTSYNDLYGITAQNFSVTGIPYTVVIDKNNQLVWTGTASDLTASTIFNIIHGNSKIVIEANNMLTNNSLNKAQQMERIFSITPKDTINSGTAQLITASLPFASGNMSAGINKNTGNKFVEIKARPLDFYYNYYTNTPYDRITNKLKFLSIYTRYENSSKINQEEFNRTELDLLRQAYHLKFVKK